MGCSVFAFTQQTVQYTQYVFNYMAINPAVIGSQKCMNLKLGYRAQWLGLQGAPRTAFGTLGTELKFKKKRTVRSKHGLGAHVESDAIGATSRTTLNLGYAYHFPFGRDVMASVGVYAGFQQFRLDANAITLATGYDPLIQGSGSKFLIPDITPGLFLSHRDWFAGMSIRQIVRNKWAIIGTDQTRNRWHYLLVGGKRFRTGKINVVPSAMLKYTGFTFPALDLNVLLELHPNFEIGASWRNTDAIAGMVKFNFLKYFSLGYAFDLTTSSMRLGSSNTHELIIGISACPNNYNDYECPVFD